MPTDSTARLADIEGSCDKVPAACTAEDGGSDGLTVPTFLDMLADTALLPDEALQRALLIERQSGERLEAVITRLGMISEDSLAKAMARYLGLATIDAAQIPVRPIDGPELSLAFLRDMRAVPIASDGEVVRVAVANPFDRFVNQAFGFMFHRRVVQVVARASDIDSAVERLYHAQAPIGEAMADAIDDEDLERLKDLVSDAPVIRAVNRLIAAAVDQRASDIHIEPTEDGVSVRFRIDGMLRNAGRLPVAMRAPLVSRIKVAARLNIAERRLPQDGRMRISVRGHDIDLRVATAPSIHGESVVLRVLDRSKLALDFVSLGFDQALIAKMREAIARPHGIVLVTGPTGSGKTSTLYAALSELNAEARKLLTVEDPIEYRLPGIIQTQVNPAIGFTFGSALRSFLRQDPDVMMVGEIRDTETAQIAVQAALTGHLILSTLHTNTAVGAVSRLLDMEVEPFLLGSVLIGVLAQRLVRRLCADCRLPYDVDEGVPQPLARHLDRLKSAHLFRAVGCDRCGGSGYNGRIALLEFLRIDAELSRLIVRRADTRDLLASAERAGMRSLAADGLSKAALGLTSIEEVLRVASEEG